MMGQGLVDGRVGQGLHEVQSALVWQQRVPDGVAALLLDEDVEGVADEELAPGEDLGPRREEVPMLQADSSMSDRRQYRCPGVML